VVEKVPWFARIRDMSPGFVVREGYAANKGVAFTVGLSG